MLRRYVKSKRHTMQVDFDAFMAQLKREIRVAPAAPPQRAIDCPCHPAHEQQYRQTSIPRAQGSNPHMMHTPWEAKKKSEASSRRHRRDDDRAGQRSFAPADGSTGKAGRNMAKIESANTETPTTRRWLSFSLRSVFVILTLLCVLLAIWARSARRQEHAMARLSELSEYDLALFDYETDDMGFYSSDGADGTATPWAPDWLRRAVGEDYFRTVRTLNLTECKISIDDVALLRNVPHLRTLFLDQNASLTDEWLSPLADLTELRRLVLWGDGIRGPGLRHIALLPHLDMLQLNDTPLADEGMEFVGQIRTLTELDLSRTRITDHGLELISALRSLICLELEETAITDRGIDYLAALPQLSHLSLDGTKISGAGLAALAKLTKLEYLWLTNTDLSDGRVEDLGKLARLKELWLPSSSFTPTQIDMLKQALPNCAVGTK